jgi:hypothetical protein
MPRERAGSGVLCFTRQDIEGISKVIPMEVAKLQRALLSCDLEKPALKKLCEFIVKRYRGKGPEFCSRIVHALRTAITQSPASTEFFTTIIAVIVVDEEFKESISADGMDTLVGLVKSSTVAVQEKAAAALWNLSANSDENKLSMMKLGCVICLASLAGEGGSAAAKAVGALRSLAKSPDALEYFLGDAAQVVSPIGALVNSISEGGGVALNALGALADVAKTQESRLAIASMGGLEAILGTLKGGTEGGEPKIQTAALYALRFAVGRCPENQKRVCDQGAEGLPKIAALLKASEVAVHEQAAVCCANLAALPENKIALANCGAIHPLVQLASDSKSEDVQRFACAAIWNLAANAGAKEEQETDNKKKIAEIGGLKVMFLLSTSSPSSAVRKQAEGALKTLANDPANARKIQQLREGPRASSAQGQTKRSTGLQTKRSTGLFGSMFKTQSAGAAQFKEAHLEAEGFGGENPMRGSFEEVGNPAFTQLAEQF